MPLLVEIMPNQKPRPLNTNVCALVYDGLCSFEFGICTEVFGLERTEFDHWYHFSVFAMDDGPLQSIGGLEFTAPRDPQTIEAADTLLIPGWRGSNEPPPDHVLELLVQAHSRGTRLLSICSGVFVLAAAGLLSGRRATTHWRYCEALAKAYPEIDVVPDVLYVDDGEILTSAGSAAGLDLCLHLVRRDWGAAIANRVAKRLVIPTHRDGGQAQFVDHLVTSEESSLSAVLDWARTHIDEPLDVDRLADRARMSSRTLSRHFKTMTGKSPGDWVQNERVRFACDLLESSDQSIEQIATASGFSSANAFRHQFRRILGTSPNQYRSHFHISAGRRVSSRGFA